ncbi:MAG: NfeD family protein [Proteobacteria bacterium]|nr:NfeD family protein [Pseudomonadota bacterium]
MRKPAWPTRVVIKYVLLQIPSFVLWILVLILLCKWFNLPLWLVWGMGLLWAAKDALLFPFVWRAYHTDRPEDQHPLIGTHGIAEQPLSPSGYIRIHGTLWRAEMAEGKGLVERGETVSVRSTEGLTLIVQPLPERTRAFE